MDCSTYQRLYEKFDAGGGSILREVWDTEEYTDYCGHFHDCQSCGDWTLEKRVRNRGVKVEEFPCVRIAYHVTGKLDSPLDNPFDDPDGLIWQFEKGDEYGIPIRDGGSSIVIIQYCPWCGMPLYDDR